jgi:hypothetical protein
MGWAASSTGSVIYTDGQSVTNLSTTVGATITLYAVWNSNSYTVTYNANGGFGTMANSTYVIGETKNLNANTFTRTGYNFMGWAASSTGSVIYTDGQNVINLSTTAGTAVILYAVWSPFFTVIYDANGGSGTMGNSIIPFGESQNLKTNAFTRFDYTFMGWASSSTGSVIYTDGQNVTDLSNIAGATVTLYAVWSLVPIDYYSSLADKLAWLQRNAQSNNVYILELSSDENIPPASLSYSGKTNIGITIISTGAERIIGLLSNGSLFTVGSGVTLTLDNNITLLGRNNNTATLVNVNTGGILVMNTGAKITGNSASNGGGVNVSGIFTMNGGDISGNTNFSSDRGGGGVFVSGNGLFRIVTGTIYGSNEADASLSNTAFEGSALYRHSGTIEYGTFSGNIWNSNGTLSTMEVSINVVSGVLLSITPIPDNYTFNVSTTAEWNSALNTIAVYGNNKNFTINVTANFNVSGRSTASFGTATGVTVSIQGSGRILTLASSRNILRIENGQTIILGDITLRGSSSNNTSLVYVVSNGTLTMNGGEISGNSNVNTNANGGGVYVGSGGTFTMNGGKITDNTAGNSNVNSNGYGGGVYVDNNGIFTMNDGKVSGNANSGVVINGNAIFTMYSGEISFNTIGHGVHVLGGTFAMYGGKIFSHTFSGVYIYSGIFTMNDGEISGNTTTFDAGSGVDVYSTGTFTMNGGKITNNINSSTSTLAAGGVYVQGTFTMNDGEISGNSGGRGGGVHVNGDFTMNGGKISNNFATNGRGGGVYINSYSNFTMNGGEIFGNSVSGSTRYGGGVYSYAGTFRIVTGTIYGSNEVDTSLRNSANSG